MQRQVREPIHGQSSVTWRAVLIGLVLIPLNTWWQVQSEAVMYLSHPTGFSLLFNVVWLLFFLLCVNVGLRRFLPRHALGQGELITVYVMLAQASALAGHSLMQILPQTLAAPYAWATPENDWRNLFGHMIPDWLGVSDPNVVGGYAGAGKNVSSFFNWPTVRAWLAPVLVWSAFTSVLVSVMVCLSAVLRRRWTDHEKLTYPIVQLPYEMTEPSLGLFRSPAFWLSFAVVGAMDVVNGFHAFYPWVPLLRVPVIPIGAELFQRSPWDAMGGIAIYFRPFIFGMLLLIPIEILFSCWTMFFFWKAQLLTGRLLGWHGALPIATSTFPPQAGGVYAGLTIIAVWTGRHHFKRAVTAVWDSLSDDGRTTGEPMSYRAATLGFFGGLVLLTAFCLKAGMSLWPAVTYLVLYLVTATAVTRMRAEVGPPHHDLHWAGPEELMVDVFGTRTIGARNLTVLSFFWYLSRAHYSDVMPHQLEGFRMGGRARMNQRHLTTALLIGSVVGVFVAMIVLVDAGYRSRHVALPWAGLEPFNRLQRWLTNPAPPDPGGVALFASGVFMVVLMMAMRTWFIWWPFHPVGFAVSLTGFWFMYIMAWAVKLAIVKHGGVRGLHRAIPFFMGLILGEFVVGGVWVLIGVVAQVRTFSITAW